MKESNDHGLTPRVLALELALEQANRRSDALLVVLGWALAKLAPDEADRFLAMQATEIEGNPRLVEHVAVLDELREELALWRANWRDAQTRKQS